MSSSSELELVIGPEYDQATFERLRDVVASLGGSICEQSWGVGGSQEVSSFQITIGSACLIATAETYIGLSLRGPNDLVRQLAAAVANPNGA
jgi:hypothetical protein